MIPTKRSSPFARARTFHVNQTPNEGETDSTEGSPFKRPSFSRTLTTPFQVLNPSLKNVRNPFEKLTLGPTTETFNSGHAKERYLEDEALDPSQTLNLFSLSQSTSTSFKTTDIKEEDSEDDDIGDNIEETDHDLVDQGASKHSMPGNNDILPDQELSASEILGGSSKKLKADYKVSSTAPLDWTLKTSFSITSQETLTWCDQGTPRDDITALQSFISDPPSLKGRGSNTSTPNASLTSSARSRLLSTTHYWMYPANNPSISQAKNISKLLKNAGNMSSSDKNSIMDLFSKASEWKQAFKALYQSCRNGACPYFYYVGSAWTILFQHGSISLSGEMEATLTHSTPGLRKVLEDEEIKFERLPDVTGKTTIHYFSSKHDLDKLDDDLEPTQVKTPLQVPLTQSSDRNLSNTLLFKGQLDVHGLFSYLLNMKTSYEDGFLYQSPNLIANVPFLHAALKRAQVTKCRVVSKPIEGTDKMQKEFRIDIQGTLLPTSVKELCNLVADQQGAAGYSCTAASDARSFGLNLRPLTCEESSQADALTSPKALDQLRYDGGLQHYSWLA
ncbi:MAG: hypothetical protein J3Q66DRAFT_207427 [Benniella sp.]|nr:MAG: hypothetical protein J3Q66DRAFT_207427 [Benniella sp.]